MPITLYKPQQSVLDQIKEEGYPSKLLALPTNFGKTLTLLSLLASDKEALTPALVIAPKRVSETSWTDDIEKLDGDLTYQLFDARKQKRADMKPKEDVDVLFTSVHNFQQAAPLIEAGHFKTLLIDEVDLMKSTTSARWKAARKLRKHFNRCWGMTGTAVPADLTTLWGMTYLIDEGKTFGTRRIQDFIQRFFIPGHSLPSGVVVSYKEKEGAREEMLSMLASMSIVRKTDESQLVSYTVHAHDLKMSEEQKRLYDYTMAESIQLIKKPGDSRDDLEEKLLESTSAKVSIMRQLTSGFQMEDGDADTAQWVDTKKLDALRYVFTGEPLLIFFQYIAERDAILKVLDEEGISYTTVKDKDAVGKWNNRKVSCFVSHPASISHGMNLQFGGSTVVWMSLPATYSIFHQGNMRLARKGQLEKVDVHMLRYTCTLEDVRAARWAKQKAGNDWLLEQ